MFVQEWNNGIETKDRFSDYRSFKTIFEREFFVQRLCNIHHRSMYAMLRAGMLPINSNIARYDPDARKRLCKLCGNKLEDETHVIFVCPFYSMHRRKFNIVSHSDIDHKSHLTTLLRCSEKQLMTKLSLFLLNTLKTRALFIEENINT